MRNTLKGRVIGPLFARVCPCFKKTVIVTCNVVSFLCNWDKFLLKNVIVFVFFSEKEIQNVIVFVFFSEKEIQNGVFISRKLVLFI